MGVKTVIKKGLSLGFQPKRWIGLEHVKSNGKVCKDLVGDLLSNDKSDDRLKKEDQEEKAFLKNMTKAELKSRKQLALVLVGFYSLVSVCLFSYSGYLWFAKSLILPGAMPIIVGFLVLVYALREFLIFGQLQFNRKRLSISQLVNLLLKAKNI